MPKRNCARLLLLLGALLSAACPLVALHNNVYLPLDALSKEVKESWLGDMMPQIKAPAKSSTTTSTPTQTYVDPYTGDIQFLPSTPGAAFQSTGEEFSGYETKFSSDY